jgi:hypothetical protein
MSVHLEITDSGGRRESTVETESFWIGAAPG